LVTWSVPPAMIPHFSCADRAVKPAMISSFAFSIFPFDFCLSGADCAVHPAMVPSESYSTSFNYHFSSADHAVKPAMIPSFTFSIFPFDFCFSGADCAVHPAMILSESYPTFLILAFDLLAASCCINDFFLCDRVSSIPFPHGRS
jgi:hypothetical protein